MRTNQEGVDQVNCELLFSERTIITDGTRHIDDEGQVKTEATRIDVRASSRDSEESCGNRGGLRSKIKSLDQLSIGIGDDCTHYPLWLRALDIERNEIGIGNPNNVGLGDVVHVGIDTIDVYVGLDGSFASLQVQLRKRLRSEDISPGASVADSVLEELILVDGELSQGGRNHTIVEVNVVTDSRVTRLGGSSLPSV